MKITTYRNYGEEVKQRNLSLELAVEAIRVETKTQPVSVFRNSLPCLTPVQESRFVDKLPVIVFGASYSKRNGQQVLDSYNGLVLLEVNKLANANEATRLRDLASTFPQTLLAFIGSSGKSVKIIVPFTLNDRTLPSELEQIEIFHANAYREAVKWYQPQLKREIELKKPLVNRGFRMSFDPNLYYNPQAIAIRMEQPVRMPSETTFAEAQQALNDPLQRLLPGYERHDIILTLFNTSMNNALNQLTQTEWEENDKPALFTKLAENCFDSGIPEEEAVKWTLVHRDLRKYELPVRTSFRKTYNLLRRFGAKPCISSSMTLVAQLDEFMRRRYQFRRNTVKKMVEYRELKSFYFDFRPLTKQVVCSISLNVTAEGIPAWEIDVKRYLDSDRVPVYDPIEEYLFNLPQWDGVDRIRPLADRVRCNNPRWRDLFYIWFLSMVSHWQQIDRHHANSTLPLLVGGQGCGKSTFCMNLLPPALRDYYTDSIDFSQRRDVQHALGRFALINMDEFDSISPSYQGFMKHILQKAVVQTRLPYAGVTDRIRRYATFIATSNNFDLLSDPTGNRRFICIEVEGNIDYSQPINYEQLYAQAMRAIRGNERYWFTHEEEAFISASNQRFLRTVPEEEVVFSCFRAPYSDEKYAELTTTEILEKVVARRKDFKCTRTAAIRLGRLLKNRLEWRRVHRGVVFKVAEV